MRSRDSRSTLASHRKSKSKCSATDPANEFSMGITAEASPFSTSRKTSAETAQGRMVASGSMMDAASWLNEPSSPWIAKRMSSSPAKFLKAAATPFGTNAPYHTVSLWFEGEYADALDH